MVDTVWLHIGTPKSGTSSLQNYLVDQKESLADSGLAYISPPGKSSSNDLAIAVNKRRPEQHDIAADLNQQILDRREPVGVISSEMFYGLPRKAVMRLLPALAERKLNILVYLRRQDRYIEAMFLQKSKNFRFLGSIWDYIAKFDGSGSDYMAMLDEWHNADDARLVPRILEKDRLTGGDVVQDALSQMGIVPPVPPGAEKNVSPAFHRVQLLQAAARADLADPRKLQRRLAAQFPQDTNARGDILSQKERVAWLKKFSHGNERLRSQYFADQETLFDDRGLTGETEQSGIPSFTAEQLEEITRLLLTVKSFR